MFLWLLDLRPDQGIGFLAQAPVTNAMGAGNSQFLALFQLHENKKAGTRLAASAGFLTG